VRHALCAAVALAILAGSASATQYAPTGAKVASQSLAKLAALEIDCESVVDVQIDTEVCADNGDGLSQNDLYGCTVWNESGPEQVYRLTVEEPTAIEVRLDSSCDLDVFIVDGCGESVQCMAYGDTGVRSLDEVSGDVFVVIDGYNGESCGYCVEFAAVEPVQELDAEDLAQAEALACGNHSISASTCSAENNLDYDSCAGYDVPGPDRWYSMTVPPFESLQATAHMQSGDVALWLISASPDCVEFIDDTGVGETEILSFQNPGSIEQTLYVVVDSYGAACDDYQLDIECSGGSVRLEQKSWAAVKSKFEGGVQ